MPVMSNKIVATRYRRGLFGKLILQVLIEQTFWNYRILSRDTTLFWRDATIGDLTTIEETEAHVA